MADLFAWLFSFYILIALIVLIIYQLMCLVDLAFDCKYPHDSSSRINKVVLLEYITLIVLCCFYLVTEHLIMLLFCTPYLYYNVTLLIQGEHLVTWYCWRKKQRLFELLFKLFYLIFILFLSSFWLING